MRDYVYLTADIPLEKQSKVQAMVVSAHKHRVGTSSADKGIHAFLIQHAYALVSNFIETNDLTYLDKDTITRFIAGGFSDPRKRADLNAAGNSASRVDGRATARENQTTSDAPVKRTRAKKSVE